MIGGVSLATSRISSNNPDWLDVSEIVKAFQEMNKVDIVFHGKVEPVAGNKELCFLISAVEPNEDDPGASTLASQRCHIGSGDHRTMESAIMWALYQLDWQLAKDEMRGKRETA